MKRRSLLLALAAACLALTATAAEITVFAAASLTNALKEIAPLYETASGDTVRFNFGSSGALARQIKEGAPADAFLSADQLRADQLEKAGLLLPGTRRTLLANTLVLIVNKDTPAEVKSFADLTGKAVRRLAIGEPKTVPAGTYAKKWLQSHNLWSGVIDKCVPLDNVRSVLAAVETGNADAGLVYKTDALISKHVTVIAEVPLSDGLNITYPAAVVKDSRQPEAAKAFLDYLAGPKSRETFALYGFLSPN
jgi:molybdate transport system substrate-binding protein